jgi:O-antigen/teichoic acid export membrane protein
VLAHSGSPESSSPWARSSLFRNGLYNLFGQAIRGIVTLVTLPFLIRFLGIREYGVWSLAYAVLGLTAMSEAGISLSATVFLSRDLCHEDFAEASKTLTFALVSALLLAGVVFLVLWSWGPLLVQLLPAFGAVERAAAARALQVAGFAVPLLILQRTLVGVEQAFNRYAEINALDLLQSLFASAGLVIVAGLGGGAVEMMQWQVLVYVLLLVMHLILVQRLLRGKGLRLGWHGERAKEMLRYSIATWTATLGSAAFTQCDRLIVGGTLGASPLGIYSAVTGITSKINLLSGAAVQPLVPVLSREQQMKVRVFGRIRQAIQLNALIALGAGVLVYVMADWIMHFLVSGPTRQDILALQIATLVYGLYSLNAPGYYILFSVGEARTNAVVTLLSGMAALALIWLGARYFGLVGALAGNAGYLGTLMLITAGLRKVGMSIRNYLAWLGLPLLCLFAGVIVGIVLQSHPWWRFLFVASQAAILSLWFFRAQRLSRMAG